MSVIWWTGWWWCAGKFVMGDTVWGWTMLKGDRPLVATSEIVHTRSTMRRLSGMTIERGYILIRDRHHYGTMDRLDYESTGLDVELTACHYRSNRVDQY